MCCGPGGFVLFVLLLKLLNISTVDRDAGVGEGKTPTGKSFIRFVISFELS